MTHEATLREMAAIRQAVEHGRSGEPWVSQHAAYTRSILAGADALAALREARETPIEETAATLPGYAVLSNKPSVVVAAPPTGEAGTLPPKVAVDTAIRQAGYSPCRSQRGVVVFRDMGELRILSKGFNRKPLGFACDGSAACKATCRVEAIHAEQDALIGARVSLSGADLLHVKAVNGQIVASGGPSCVACSKLIVEAGIAGVWLYHGDGWRRYPSVEFHRLSLAALAAPVPAAPPDLVELVRRVIAAHTKETVTRAAWADKTEPWSPESGQMFEAVLAREAETREAFSALAAYPLPPKEPTR